MKTSWRHLFLFLLLMGLASSFGPHAAAESYRCTESIGVFDLSLPNKQIGQFNAGTKLEIGQPAATPGMVHVSYLGHDGKFIAGLCRSEDVGKASKSSSASGPKPVIISKPKPLRRFEWLEEYPQASQYAKEENKLLLMDFTGSDWCGWCMKLDEEIFSKQAFKDYAEENLVLLKVDFPKHKTLPSGIQQQNQNLAHQYHVQGYPTVVILDSQGQQVGTLGYMEGGPAAFIAELKLPGLTAGDSYSSSFACPASSSPWCWMYFCTAASLTPTVETI